MVSWDTLAEGVASIEREANQQILRDQLKPHLCFHTRDRQFRATFGISSELACLLWMMLDVENEGPEGAEPKHLLWTLHFLKTYGSEDVVASHCGVHPSHVPANRLILRNGILGHIHTNVARSLLMVQTFGFKSLDHSIANGFHTK